MTAEPQWLPHQPRAIPAIDNLRSVVILLVVAVHVLLPYFSFLPAKPYAFDRQPWLWRSFPLVDSHRLLGFDLLGAWVDVFVMATFFLLSGLFVWPRPTSTEGSEELKRDDGRYTRQLHQPAKPNPATPRVNAGGPP